MSERVESHLLIGLVKEVLGPRSGPQECLPSERDPRHEYITGVLAPELHERDTENDVDADIDEIAEEVADDEDQGAEGVIIAPPSAFSPALDPKSQPRSIGLSFVIRDADGIPRIDICTTWARYIPSAQGGWQRSPHAKVLLSMPVVGTPHNQPVGPDVDLYLRSRLQKDGSYRVSLYLVNQRRVVEGQKIDTSDFVFQPQIRVHCVSGSLCSVDREHPEEGQQNSTLTEDMELAMLYRNRGALARGHLCGAMWKDIDPERPHPTLSSPQEAPFAWTDRSLVSTADQAKFLPADVRTEFVPCYPIEAPEVKWVWSTGTPPELNPLVLAETWEPTKIHQYLDPLYEFFTGYHRMLYRAIEPITVTPFAPRARDRGLGPLAVILLRQARQIDGHPLEQPWHIEQHNSRVYISQAYLMEKCRRNREVQALASIFEQRAMQQPQGRRPSEGIVAIEADAELDRWKAIVHEQIQDGGSQTDSVVYAESSMIKEPKRAVILGDAQHQQRQLRVAFENTHQSLRDVEEITQFREQ